MNTPRYIKRRFVFLLHLLFFMHATSVNACQCPVTVLSLQECEKYDVIFRGKVLNTTTCNNKPGTAVFDVLELYKGNAEKTFNVLFDCEGTCFYEFKAGEEWIIYSHYKQVNTAKMDYCSRSRRYFNSANEDYYTSTSGNDYEDELKFLREKLGLHRVLENKQNKDYSRNVVPNNSQSVVILLISIGAIIVFYIIFSRFVK